MAYKPLNPPLKDTDLADYVFRELLRISEDLSMIESGLYLPWANTEPKPREGRLALAPAGGAWDPGAGKGLYEYRDGAWHKL